MAGSERQVAVKIVGDAKGLASAVSDAEGSLNRLKAGAVAVGGALAAAFAASKVVDFFGDAIRSGIEEERAMALLAQTLRDTTGARQDDIDATEAWITATQNATGVADDHLRPALQNLLNATHDLAEAQQLLPVAMDIATSRGLDLETVTLALSKAYNGNITALGRMGIAVKDNEGNVLSFQQVMQGANAVFGGATQKAADTTSGKLAVMSAKFKDMKEGIGMQLLPVLNVFVGYISQTFIPNIGRIWTAFTSGDGVINRVIDILNSIKWAFQHAINAIIDILNVGISAYNKIPLAPNIGKIGTSDIHEGDIPHLNIGGGGTKTGGGLANLVDSVKGAFANGGIALFENQTGGGGGAGGGKGGDGGKSAAEKQAEADQKAIEDTLKIWAQARIDKRDAEDNMYKDGQISADKYKAILEQRLTEEKAFTNEWQREQDKLTAMLKEQEDKRVKDAKDEADERKKILDQQIKDQQDAFRKQQDIQDNEYDVAAISADQYLSILRARLQGQEQFTDEWTATFKKIQQVSEAAGLGPVSAASLGANAGGGGDSVSSGGVGMLLHNPTINVTANNPQELVNALTDYARRNGGLRVPGGVVTV